MGPAIALIALAAGIILTLIGRPLIGPVSRKLETCVRRKRVLDALRRAGSATLNEFILPGPSGGLVPVDHAALVPGGVVCVLVKHYNGMVFASGEATQWTCVDGGRRHRFMNPVMQNDNRIQAMRNAVPELPVKGLVVFTGPVEFPDERPPGVIPLSELQEALDALEFDAEAVDPVEDWEATWLRLRAAALTDDESRKDLDAQVSFG